MGKSKQVELELEIVAETDRAYLFSDGDTENWVPKSQIDGVPEKNPNGNFLVLIPEWLAIEKDFI